MTDDHRDRRVAESSKLQALINDLSKVPPARRMYLVHDEIMHAIDASLRTHKGHKFEVAEIELIRDVAFAIVYTLDPSTARLVDFLLISGATSKRLVQCSGSLPLAP
jgi:hypothetical protein